MKLSNLLLAACFAAASPMAGAHAALKTAQPAADAVLDKAPKEIVINFNEKVEAAFSSIALKDAANNVVADGKANVDAADATVLRLALPALGAGVYSVKWVGVGHDGHRRTGEYKFTVK